MNFIQLCQAVARESGSVAGLPSFNTVVGAAGRLAKIVAWVSDAWVQIQSERTDWLFRQNEFSHALIIGQSRYTAADLGLADLGRFLPDTNCRMTMSLYDPATGVADERAIRQGTYEEWRRCYFLGSQTNNRPVMWAQGPDGRLCVGPAPDKAYMLRGLYQRSVQVLAADADTPIMPSDFHNVIVAQALRNMIQSDESFESFNPKALKYEALRNALVMEQTPQVLTF